MPKSSMRKKNSSGRMSKALLFLTNYVNISVFVLFLILIILLGLGSSKEIDSEYGQDNKKTDLLYNQKDSITIGCTLIGIYFFLFGGLYNASANDPVNGPFTIFITSMSLLIITILARICFDLQRNYITDNKAKENFNLQKYLTWDFDYEKGEPKPLNIKNWFVSLIFGLMFGFIDNYGLAIGLDKLEETVFQWSFFRLGLTQKNKNESNNFIQGWGNTFSDLLGVTIADSVANIISTTSGSDKSNLISDALGVGLGCLIGVLVIKYSSKLNFDSIESFKNIWFPLILISAFAGCFIFQTYIFYSKDNNDDLESQINEEEKHSLTGIGIFIFCILFIIFLKIFLQDTSILKSSASNLLLKVLYYIIIFGYLCYFTILIIFHTKHNKKIKLGQFINENINIETGEITKYSSRDVILSLIFGMLFGAIDNIGLFIGAGSFGELIGSEKTKEPWGNTYSDLIGATVGTFISKISIFKYTDTDKPYQGGPIWANSISIIIGCIIPILFIGIFAIFGDKYTFINGEWRWFIFAWLFIASLIGGIFLLVLKGDIYEDNTTPTIPLQN